LHIWRMYACTHECIERIEGIEYLMQFVGIIAVCESLLFAIEWLITCLCSQATIRGLCMAMF
jgi:hypothetical protein